MSLSLKQTVWRPSGQRNTISTPPAITPDTPVAISSADHSTPLPVSSSKEVMAEPSPASVTETCSASPALLPSNDDDDDMDGLTDEERQLLRRLRQLLPPIEEEPVASNAGRTEGGTSSPHEACDRTASDDNVFLSLQIVANITYRENCLRRCLRHWRAQRSRHEQTRHRQDYFAQQYFHRTVMYVMFRAWQWRCRTRQERRVAVQQVQVRRARFLQEQVWRHWLAHVLTRRRQRAAVEVLAEKQAHRVRHEAWCTWRDLAHRRHLASALACVQEELLCESRFRAWVLWVHQRQRQALLLSATRLTLSQRPTSLLLVPAPTMHQGDHSNEAERTLEQNEEEEEELRWRQEQAMRGVWIHWLRWTCRQRAARLHVYTQKLALLESSNARHRLNRAWRTWLLFTVLVHMQLLSTQRLARRWWEHWQTLALMRQRATHQALLSATRTPMRYCFGRWRQRYDQQQSSLAKAVMAEHFYCTTCLLRRSWRTWRRAQRASALNRATEEGRQRLLQHIALNRLMDNAFSTTPEPARTPTPPVQAPESYSGEALLPSAYSFNRQQPIPLHHTAFTAATPADPPHASPTTLDTSSAAHMAQPMTTSGNPHPLMQTVPASSQPADVCSAGVQWPYSQPLPAAPVCHYSGGMWYAIPPQAMAAPMASSGFPWMMPPPGLTWPIDERLPGVAAQAPPSTVASVPTESATAHTQIGHACPSCQTPAQHRSRRSRRRRAESASRVSSATSSGDSASSASENASRLRWHSPNKGGDTSGRKSPPRRSHRESPRVSLVPVVPTVGRPVAQPGGASRSVMSASRTTASSQDAFYNEGRELLLAYKARKAVAQDEEAELAHAEAELRLLESTLASHLSADGVDGVPSLSFSRDEDRSQAARIRDLQERFVYLHQRRLQREQLKAQLRQFVTTLRRQGYADNSLGSFLDASLARSE